MDKMIVTSEKYTADVVMKTMKGQINTEIIITETLMDVGIDPALLGYRYLRDAVWMVLEEPSIMDNATKGLYPNIAELHNSTPSRVERAIRNAIEVAFGNVTDDVTTKYFGNVISMSSGKVTNTTFIACMVQSVKLKLLNCMEGETV